MTGSAVELTQAQWRVVDCLGRRMSYAEAAKELGCVRTTVKAHVFAIAQKIGKARLNPEGLPQKAAVMVFAMAHVSPEPIPQNDTLSNTSDSL